MNPHQRLLLFNSSKYNNQHTCLPPLVDERNDLLGMKRIQPEKSSFSSSSSVLSTTTSPTVSTRQYMQYTSSVQEGQTRVIKETSPICPSSVSSSSSSSSSSHGRLHVSMEDMSKYFHASQMIAARMLGVSVSTLKRRYKEVSNGNRWPYSKMSLNEKKEKFVVLHQR
ncbi:hypothetical protein FDP41_001523 [Naegleria fowleri]|uniref:RWP-RK domain-containing protein n=1 Tax=Naegleria fowleri TaxID=5763 RepID=A0A6A5C028_NAEFO|nr:uncharacterized protein FDP41_001523 [Naegleria fowleri]KAF0979180.1 hypothetical protein FDP41_001523 [Naegleria fowleri]